MKYGHLTFICEVEERSKRNRKQWKVLCDCGNEAIKEEYLVKTGATKSCGCLKQKTVINIGDRFGKLTVMERAKNNTNQNKPKWICKCDCGNTITVSGGSLKKKNTRSCGCLYKELVGPKSSGWKGGRHIDSGGYILVWDRDHPNANKRGYVREHIKVVSDYLGRPIKKSESVHHKNGNRKDNRIKNLELWNSHQPNGQRIEDKLEYAWEIINTYDSNHEKNHGRNLS